MSTTSLVTASPNLSPIEEKAVDGLVSLSEDYLTQVSVTLYNADAWANMVRHMGDIRGPVHGGHILTRRGYARTLHTIYNYTLFYVDVVRENASRLVEFYASVLLSLSNAAVQSASEVAEAEFTEAVFFATLGLGVARGHLSDSARVAQRHTLARCILAITDIYTPLKAYASSVEPIENRTETLMMTLTTATMDLVTAIRPSSVPSIVQ